MRKAVLLLLAVAAGPLAAEAIPGVDTTYEVVKEWDGNGGKVNKGAKVTVHATGSVEETGKSERPELSIRMHACNLAQMSRVLPLQSFGPPRTRARSPSHTTRAPAA